jgi:copper chaperone CopZ
MPTLKMLAIALAVATGVPALAPALAHAQPQAAARTAPIAADAVVSVNGLVCDFCAQAIEKSFRRRAEVNDVRVDLTAKLVSIDFKPGANLDDAALNRIITNAGYAVTGVRRTAVTP